MVLDPPRAAPGNGVGGGRRRLLLLRQFCHPPEILAEGFQGLRPHMLWGYSSHCLQKPGGWKGAALKRRRIFNRPEEGNSPSHQQPPTAPTRIPSSAPTPTWHTYVGRKSQTCQEIPR